MNSALQGLEPKELWSYFEAIAAIPRNSGDEAAARTYVLAEAARLGLAARVDAVGNVVVSKPATAGKENVPVAALQGHLDMVCEKRPDISFDFKTQGIELVRDGEWLKANGTTLGADNGLGVAAGMAIMAATDIPHGPLEFLFTIDEETGLTGAGNLGEGMVTAKYLLNLDNEEEGTLCIGCAGGLDTNLLTPVVRRPAGAGKAFTVTVEGLRGGHSGVDIDKGRGNAVRILARALRAAASVAPFELAGLHGGSKRNVIPRDGSAVVVLDGELEGLLRASLDETAAAVRSELGGFDTGLQITVAPAERPESVIIAEDCERILALLVSLPNGIVEMSPSVPGLVQTSTNVGTVHLSAGGVTIETLQRSSVESAKWALGAAVATVAKLAGFEVDQSGSYPGWKPEPESDLVQACQRAHEKALGAPAKLIAMHAGLECGVIGEKVAGMQMISLGPQIENAHSPSERAGIASTEAFWRLLKGVLAEL